MTDELLKKKLHQAALNSVYGIPTEDKRYKIDWCLLRSDNIDTVVMSPTVMMSVHEWEKFVSSKWRLIIKKVNRPRRCVELLSGHRVFFKGETEGKEALIGLHANIISAEMFSENILPAIDKIINDANKEVTESD